MNDQVVEWFRTEGAWWACSFVFHALLACAMMLVATKDDRQQIGEAPSLGDAQIDQPEQPKLEKFEVGDPPLDPTELTTESLTLMQPPGGPKQEEKFYDKSDTFSEAGGGIQTTAAGPQLGGLGGFNAFAPGLGVAATGKGGVGISAGTGAAPGAGGGGSGFGGRGTGHRKYMAGAFGGTKTSERAVAAALNWLYRHQSPDGSWGLDNYVKMCKDPSCTGPGNVQSQAGATAMALLPYLAAGQTHESPGPYKTTIYRGLYWLMSHQTPAGDLSAKSSSQMYSHGLAAIAICEAYGLSKDRTVGAAAQKAVRFIVDSQNKRTGGWRYTPGEEGDTSVVGWQVMALKSAMMAGIYVDHGVFDLAKQFLKSCSSGAYGGQFCYQPGAGATPTMSAVGLLCNQYLGAQRSDPLMTEGVGVLMSNLPDNNARSLYYWYYATQVMHNVPGPEWETWNRKMRKALIESQVKERCAAGSWDPEKPSKDPWSDAGGRIMVTSLACLSLEVYYRYLPLYKLDAEAGAKGAVPPAAAPPAAAPPAAAPPAAAKPAAAPPAAAPPAAAPPAAAPPAAAPPAAAPPAAAPPAAAPPAAPQPAAPPAKK